MIKNDDENEILGQGVSATGLAVNYIKYQAKNPNFWQQYPAHGKPTREKPLFKDEFMPLFITSKAEELANQLFDPKLRLAIAVRHRFFTRVMAASIKQDKDAVKQVVILGSGCDTHAVRKEKYSQKFGVKFFEIDLPAVLDAKEKIYKKNHINKNAVFIGMDYTQEDWIQALKNNRLDFSLPTHFIWEGNTMYIPKEKINSMLHQIKNNFLGKVILSFDYLSEKTVRQITSSAESNKMVDNLRAIKAPIVTGYTDIAKELAEQFDFIVTDNSKCAELTKKYGAGDAPYVSQENYYLCTMTNKRS